MLNDRIKQRRQELNMSQDELATKTGYKTKSAISRIESGQRDITQSQVELFAKALETTPSFLMGWDEEQSSNKESTKEDIRILDPFSKLNAEGKEKAISYTQDLVDSGKYTKHIKEDTVSYMPSREDMLDYLKEIPMAAFDGKLNIYDMSEEDLYSLYKLIKENE